MLIMDLKARRANTDNETSTAIFIHGKNRDKTKLPVLVGYFFSLHIEGCLVLVGHFFREYT